MVGLLRAGLRQSDSPIYIAAGHISFHVSGITQVWGLVAGTQIDGKRWRVARQQFGNLRLSQKPRLRPS